MRRRAVRHAEELAGPTVTARELAFATSASTPMSRADVAVFDDTLASHVTPYVLAVTFHRHVASDMER